MRSASPKAGDEYPNGTWSAPYPVATVIPMKVNAIKIARILALQSRRTGHRESGKPKLPLGPDVATVRPDCAGSTSTCRNPSNNRGQGHRKCEAGEGTATSEGLGPHVTAPYCGARSPTARLTGGS